MSNSLRDRIIAAITAADQDWCSDTPLHEDMADAVIAELNLRVEYGWLDHEDSGFLYDSLDEAQEYTHGSGETLKSRLVSDWGDVPEEPDDEPAEKNSLMERLVVAALDALADGDPVIKIGIGNAEIRIGWW